MLNQLRSRMAELTEQRGAAIDAMTAITEAAEGRDDAERSLTPDEDVAFVERMGQVTAIDTELDELLERVTELEAIEARTVVADEKAPFIFNHNMNRDPRDLSDVRFGGDVRNELAGRVRRILDNDNERELTLSGPERASVNRLLQSTDTKDGIIARHIITHSSDHYRNAWAKMVSDNAILLTNEERSAMVEARAASLTDGEGGFAVPFTLDPTIISTDAGSSNPMRQIATVKTTLTDSWNGVSSAGVTASWDGEAAEVSDDAPTLVQPSIPVYKGQAFVPFSVEVGMDWANIEADLRSMFMDAKDNLEATAHFTGTGSAQPTGITTALDGTASEIAPTTAEVFAPLTDLYLIEEALAARYRANASVTANKAIYNDVRAANDNTHSFWERVGGGQPPTLLGYPAYEASAMDGAINAAATEDNFVMVIGDFRAGYYVVDRVGMSVELVPHLLDTTTNLPNGQRGLLAWWRTGGDSVNDGAFAMLSIPTTV